MCHATRRASDCGVTFVSRHQAQVRSRAELVYLRGWWVWRKAPAYSLAYLDTNASFVRPHLLSHAAGKPGVCDTLHLPEEKGGLFPGGAPLAAPLNERTNE